MKLLEGGSPEGLSVYDVCRSTRKRGLSWLCSRMSKPTRPALRNSHCLRVTGQRPSSKRSSCWPWRHWALWPHSWSTTTWHLTEAQDFFLCWSGVSAMVRFGILVENYVCTVDYVSKIKRAEGHCNDGDSLEFTLLTFGVLRPTESKM